MPRFRRSRRSSPTRTRTRVSPSYLQSTYDQGIKNITIPTASASTYCIQSAVGGKTWNKSGPAADLATGPARSVTSHSMTKEGAERRLFFKTGRSSADRRRVVAAPTSPARAPLRGRVTARVEASAFRILACLIGISFAARLAAGWSARRTTSRRVPLRGARRSLLESGRPLFAASRSGSSAASRSHCADVAGR